MDEPFLSIVTRCFKRPKMLFRCIESVSKQTDNDYEHVLCVDNIGIATIPGEWQKQGDHLFRHARRIHGKYIYMLDDDDFLIDNDFVKGLKEVCQDDPDVIFVKMSRPFYGVGQILPNERCWGIQPVQDLIGTPCFVVKRETWMNFIPNFRGDGADFQFIESIFRTNPKVYWWDRVVTQVGQAGQKRPEGSDGRNKGV